MWRGVVCCVVLRCARVVSWAGAGALAESGARAEARAVARTSAGGDGQGQGPGGWQGRQRTYHTKPQG